MANEKLKEALHYVISRCDDPSRLGAIRLNKIMWFADRHAYRANGTSITADTYVKRKLGPVPKSVLPAIAELASEGRIVVRETMTPNEKVMRHYFSMQEVNTGELSDHDRRLLRVYTDLICQHYSANEISELTHDQVWEAAELGEEIPLFATFAVAGEITQEVKTWASQSVMARAA